MIFSFVLLRLTLTRRLKNHLQPKGQYWDSGTIDFGFINTAIFCWACVIPSMTKWKNYQIIYGNLDVKSFANKFEIGLSYTMIIGLCTLFLFGGAVAVLK